MLNLVRYNCDVCGEEIQAACLSELQRKKAEHKCHPVSKRVERTLKAQQAQVDQFMQDVTVDRINQHNFEQLIRQGMIVNA